jgi:dGTPase
MHLVGRPDGFRERAEEFERASLSTWAVLSAETKGRDRFEEPDPVRTVFQVDAHRILRARAFQGLSGKAAAVGPAGTTWLAVVLEAARLADALARALRLNADLTRAVALGHALGAAPFGAAGTRALADYGYDPAEQSVRVAERLERDGAGLNLTWETRDGIHTIRGPREPATVEGQAARLAVQIAEVTLGPPPGSPATSAAAVLLGEDAYDWADGLVADAARASLDRPEVRLSGEAARVASALAAAGVEARRADSRLQAELHRAVHCLQSLAIYALERHGSGDADARRAVVDELTGCSDRDIVAAYRARFEPGT